MKTIDKIMIGSIGFGAAMILGPIVSKFDQNLYSEISVCFGPVIAIGGIAYFKLDKTIRRAYERSNQGKI